MIPFVFFFVFFFFNDTATTEIYTLSLHDALPISRIGDDGRLHELASDRRIVRLGEGDRKSTRLNSSHGYISYAVFCLKKKKEKFHIILDDRQQHSPQVERAVPALLARHELRDRSD